MNCIICGAPRASYVTADGEGICDRHSSYSWCQSCLRPIERGVYCASCNSTANHSVKSVEKIREQVLDWYTRMIGAHSLDSIPVELSGKPDLDYTTMGMTVWRTDGKHLDSSIFLFESLSADVLRSTLVHEYAHVVLLCDPLDFRFSGDSLTSIESEGFCEFMAYSFLGEPFIANTARQRKRLLSNEMLVYSDGLRMMLDRVGSQPDIPQLVGELTGRPIRRPAPAADRIRRAIPIPPIAPDSVVKQGTTRPLIEWRDHIKYPPIPPAPHKPERQQIKW